MHKSTLIIYDVHHPGRNGKSIFDMFINKLNLCVLREKSNGLKYDVGGLKVAAISCEFSNEYMFFSKKIVCSPKR